MKKRWLLRLGLLAGLALFGFWFVLWLTAPEHRINEWHMRQIKKGMTLNEVKSILRASPGEYTSTPLSMHQKAKIVLSWSVLQMEMIKARDAEGKEIPNMLDGRAGFKTWLTDQLRLVVWIDSNEEVLDLRWMTADNESIIGKIRRWLLIP